ncbi:hypothetical protein G7Y79_00067g095790 [Physcia stellaris]|nr:hypothetical protein G7Y79_00067g095790 [Physcia stellaris]
MHAFTLLAPATLVLASQSVDFSSPKTISSLRTRLGNLDYHLGASVAAELEKTRFNASSSSCLTTCTVLALLLKNQVVHQGSSAFADENNYWSDQQKETTPACRINPSSTEDVAATLLVAEFLNCQFAVKSGGHAAFKGASNIQAGITIDLKYLNQFEIVLASGRILNVDEQSHPDLYFALRGGGNNFGIVTRFDFETFPQGNLWGGMNSYPLTANASIYNAFNNFANDATSDPDAALIVAVAYALGSYFCATDIEYAKPVVNPPIFHEFTAIPTLTSTMRITNLTDLTLELNASNPSGFRETYTTATFRNSPELQIKITELFVHEIETIKDAAGLLPALVMQPITEPMISHFSKRGGNALGIAESDGPLILLNIAIMWSSVVDDERVIAASKRITDGAIALAKSMGLDHRFIYQNYASLDQDVFAGYGEANKQRLIETSKKYDPDQVFQRLQPGYFKLNGKNGRSIS